MKLFPVQIEAKKRAKGKRRFGFFLEMGLGKSSLVLAEFEELMKRREVEVLVVICPYSLISAWRDENAKHGFNYPVVVCPKSVAEIKPPCIVLYNYEALIATAGQLIPDLLANFKCYVAFDESVQIKSFNSDRWKAINFWRGDCHYVRLLSGRPMVQSPLDLWTQLLILGAGVNPSPYAFRNAFCKMGGYMNKEILGVKNQERLTELVASVSFTASKKDWTNLPPKLYAPIRTYDMTKDQAKKYRAMFDEMVLEIGTNVVSVDMAVHKFVKLQQISSGFVLDEDGETGHPIMPFDKVPKVKLLREVLDEITGKTLIFAHYRYSCDRLIEMFGNCPFIRGGMKEDEIAENKRSFNEGDAPYMVLQESSGKYGHTLLGTEAMPCYNTVYFENSYSLDDRIQSEDRNHRYGQEWPVLYTDLAGSPVEHRTIKSLQRKDDLSRTVLGIIQGGYK